MAQKDKQTYNTEMYIKKIKAAKEVYAERKKFLQSFSLKRQKRSQKKVAEKSQHQVELAEQTLMVRCLQSLNTLHQIITSTKS